MSTSYEHEAPDEAAVAAYLANRLDPSLADAFEAYCLRHPNFARRVESDLFIKVGFRQMLLPDRIRRTVHRRRVVLGIAAGIALVVGCGLLLRPSVHSDPLLAYRSATEVPASLVSLPRVAVTLIRVREGSAVHRIVAPQKAGILMVRVAPDTPPGPQGYAIEAELEPGAGLRSVTLNDLHTDPDGYIEMYLPLAAVVGHTLMITLDPSPSTGTESLSFRLQVGDAPHTQDGPNSHSVGNSETGSLRP